jgi:hypothetical protein
MKHSAVRTGKLPGTPHAFKSRTARSPLPLVIRFVRRRPVLLPLALAVLAIGGGGCRQGAQRFGDTPAAARQHADEFLGAVALRFTDVYRTPKFALARPRLGRYAMTPSKIQNDTSIWTSQQGDGTRVLNLAGYSNGSRYIFNPSKDWPVPTRVGQSRHLIRLRPLGDSEFEWRTDVHQAVGTMPAATIANVFDGFFRAVEVLPEGVLRAEALRLFPRTSTALGRLFSVDSLRAVPHRAGGRMVTLVVRLHPNRLETSLPAFASYVRKYVSPAHYDWTLREPGGVTWARATADDERLMVAFRVQDGDLQPFEGPARPMPATLRLEGQMFAKVMIFEVGASKLVADVVRVREAHEDGWRLGFRQEPEWHLPLATRHLIRAPLRRPFEQGGTTAWLTLRADGGVTHLSRGFRTVVKESAILRWLGALGWTAMSDFAGASEAEENRFIAEAFTAMRLDSRDVLRPDGASN